MEPNSRLLSIGHHALHRWRRTLEQSLGADAAACLQEIGAATGEEIYGAFCQWLPSHTGLDDPGELDAERFGEVLSAFFSKLGWGALAVDRLGSAGLVISTSDWAEAEPEAHAAYPCCFFSSGLFADLLTRFAGAPLAIMEVACRSRSDDECRFFAAAPETLEAAYQAMTAGQDYRAIFDS